MAGTVSWITYRKGNAKGGKTIIYYVSFLGAKKPFIEPSFTSHWPEKHEFKFLNSKDGLGNYNLLSSIDYRRWKKCSGVNPIDHHT